MSRPTSTRLSNNFPSKFVRPIPTMRKGTPTTIINSSSTPTPMIRLIHSQNQTRMKNVQLPVERIENPTIFHQWNEDFQKTFRRPKFLKPMVKDPYTPLKGVVHQVTRSLVTEREVSLPLISPKAIKIIEPIIRTAPQRSTSKNSNGKVKFIRYLRRNELLPSENSAQIFSPNRLDIVPLQYEKSSILLTNSTAKVISNPRRTPIERLLHRDQLKNDSSLLRRPPRKLLFSSTEESFVRFPIPT